MKGEMSTRKLPDQREQIPLPGSWSSRRPESKRCVQNDGRLRPISCLTPYAGDPDSGGGLRVPPGSPTSAGTPRPIAAQTACLRGVSDGTRTRDRLDHNQELYQLSYAHRAWVKSSLPAAGAGSRLKAGQDALAATAARISSTNASSSSSSPSRRSRARRVPASRLALKMPVGSSMEAPLAKVSLTLSL